MVLEITFFILYGYREFIRFRLHLCLLFSCVYDLVGELYTLCNYHEIVSAGKLQRFSRNCFSFFVYSHAIFIIIFFMRLIIQ